jgi:hypothetical protein
MSTTTTEAAPKKPRSPFRPMKLSALDERMMTCQPGGYPWDDWRARALAAGVGDQLAWAGRAVMREAYNHDWPKRLQRECGWSDDGAAMLALKHPEKAKQRWEWLEATDGGRYFGNL